MTVEQLIEALRRLPRDAEVVRKGDEYASQVVKATKVVYHATGGFGIDANTAVLM